MELNVTRYGFGLPFWGLGFDDRRDPVPYRELAAVWRPYVETASKPSGSTAA